MEDLGARIVAAFRDAVANKTLRVATALGIAVVIVVTYGIWLDWEWKAMIGWKALEGYINPAPDDTTGKKDAVQVYAVIVAGVIASITATVGLANLRLTRKNSTTCLFLSSSKAPSCPTARRTRTGSKTRRVARRTHSR